MSVVKSLLIVSKCYEIVQLNSIRSLPDLISLISFIVLPFTQLWASSNIILSSILLASSTSIPEKRTEPLFIRDLHIIRILWVNRIFPFDIALPIPPDRFQMNASRVVLHFHFLTFFFRQVQVHRNPLCMVRTVICTSLKFTPFPHTKIKNTEYLKAYYAVTFHTRGQLLGIEVYPVIDRQLNWQLKHAFAKIVLCYFIFIIFLG